MTSLLVGVDASDRSRDAIAFAVQLAAPSGADVLLANVFPYEVTPSRASNPAYSRILETEADKLLDSRREELGDAGGARVRTVAIGRHSAPHGLHDLAESEGAALIVVGSSHVGAVGRVMPGSTAERLLHGATCPVAIVPKDYRPAPTPARVGVAYDGSEESRAALRGGVEIARATGASLRVIRVLDTSAFAAPALMAGPAYDVTAEELERRPREELDRVVGELETPAEAWFATGDPAHVLAEESEKLDLLVTGSRGYGPLRAVLTGGVTGRLLREAACPVIVLPRGVAAPLSSLFAGTAASA